MATLLDSSNRAASSVTIGLFASRSRLTMREPVTTSSSICSWVGWSWARAGVTPLARATEIALAKTPKRSATGCCFFTSLPPIFRTAARIAPAIRDPPTRLEQRHWPPNRSVAVPKTGSTRSVERVSGQPVRRPRDKCPSRSPPVPHRRAARQAGARWSQARPPGSRLARYARQPRSRSVNVRCDDPRPSARACSDQPNSFVSRTWRIMPTMASSSA